MACMPIWMLNKLKIDPNEPEDVTVTFISEKYKKATYVRVKPELTHFI